ncbi:MAG: PAS domain-containing protein [Verrucomicrobiota bacterium]
MSLYRLVLVGLCPGMNKYYLRALNKVIARSSSRMIGLIVALSTFIIMIGPILITTANSNKDPSLSFFDPARPLVLTVNEMEIFTKNLEEKMKSDSDIHDNIWDLEPDTEKNQSMDQLSLLNNEENKISLRKRILTIILGIVLSLSLGVVTGLFHQIIILKKRDQKDLLRLLNSLTSQIPGMVYQFELRKDGRRRFPYTSWGVRKILGIKTDRIQQDAAPFFQRVHPEDLKALEKSIADSANELAPWNHSFRYRSDKENYKWLQGQSVPERLSNKSILWHGFMTDISKRKERELHLQDSEERWSLALAGTNVGVWDWNIQTDTIFFSERWKEMLGYSPDEVIQAYSDWKSLIHKDDVKAFVLDLNVHFQGSTQFYESTHRMVHYNGSAIWVLSRGKAHFDENGNPIRMVGTQTDITLQKQMEKQIKENENRLRDVLEAAGESVWEVDLDFRYTYLSQCVEKEIGYTPEELMGKTPFELILEEDKERITNWFMQAAKERINFSNLTYRIKCKNGSILWQKVSGLPLCNEQGALVGYRGASLDITQAKEAQEKIQQLNDRFQFAQSTAKFGVWDYDILRDRLEWDAITLELYDMPAEKFTGKLNVWEKALHPDDRNQAMEEMSRAIQAKNNFHIQFRILDQKQQIRHLRLVARICENKSGHRERLIGITSDITHDKANEASVLKAKEEAEVASKAKSEFLAMMSHEIRTPMNGIIGFSKLLASSELNSEQQDYTRTIVSSAELLLTLINDILDYSKIESGKFELEYLPVEPKAIVEDVYKILLPQAKEKSLKFEYKISSDVPGYISSDPIRLHQILLNLANNAIKFTQKGHVKITVNCHEKLKDTLAICVQDTGIGIADDRQNLLFKPFSQTDSSNARIYGGSGLGLAICYKLTELLGGKIWVETEVGKGTSFHFTIKYSLVSVGKKSIQISKETKKNSSKNRPNNHIKILLAEDNPVNAKLAQILFKRLGYKLTWAKNGKEAVKQVKENQFDLIFMDVQMPEMDGYEATQNIQKLYQKDHDTTRPVIIAMTANAMKGDREKCLDAGMDEYLTKPIQESQVSEMLQKYQNN